MVEVFLATDNDLRRQVAMKLLRKSVGTGREALLHFVAEAQATSQLEHPGIPPVHDIGTMGVGRPWFAMKLVRGRTLHEVLHDLLLKRREVQAHYTLHRLGTILERVAETLHFAHERGVIHRDIKPSNIMLGDYGEVHVMDWGLAHVDSRDDEYEYVETVRTEDASGTQAGSIKGTPAYMSPEQAVGDPIDARTDIYALGCVLYEMLTLHRAFAGDTEGVFFSIQAGLYPDVMERNPRRNVPAALAEVCRKAMSYDAQDRYATAGKMGEALRGWLDGRAERERRTDEAERLVARGEDAAARYETLREETAAAEAEADSVAASFKPWQSVAEKRPMIEARRRLQRMETRLALAFSETTELLTAALTQQPDHEPAHRALARLWRAQLIDAERCGAESEAARARAMVERYGKEEFAPFLQGDGSLTLFSEPSAASVVFFRYEERDGVLVAAEERSMGETPLARTQLPMGSYLCVLKKEGYRDTRYPVHITRNQDREGTVTLRADDSIGEDFVYVPGGPCLVGEGRRTRAVDIGDFAIARYPVTFLEYGLFLDSLSEEQATEHLPRARKGGVFMMRGDDGRWCPRTDLFEDDIQEAYLERYGEGFEQRLPAYGVNWHDAVAYCAWRSETTGIPYRLPTEEEREKAARGVDGRRFPWGDFSDPSLGKCRESRPENPQPEPVGTFATAASVYGMGDAAGGIWEWTDSWFDQRQSSRVLRGGSWLDAISSLRCADRGFLGPTNRFPVIGFRGARDL